MQLAEQYRPRTWAAVVGHARTLRSIAALSKRGLAGRAYWIAGPSGVGKTTIARLLAETVADPICIDEIDAGEATPPRLREIEQGLHFVGWGKGGRAVLVNEANGLSAASVRQLLVMLERLPRHAIVVFTTTSSGQQRLFGRNIDADPLLSRCTVFDLSAEGLLLAFAQHAKTVAAREGLDGRPLADYTALLKRCKCNLRAAFQEIEKGKMRAE